MLVKFFLYLIVGNFLLLTLLYIFQRHLIYFPSSEVVASPTDAGVPEMRVIELHTRDGVTIKAWYRPPLYPHMPTLLYLHGNAGNISNRAMLVKPYLKEGFGVLLLTYRGYSGNPGTPSEEGLYQDARSAIGFLKQENVPEKCLVLMGESIGGAVAIQMATEYFVGAIILQAPFTSLVAVGQFHYPFLPIKFFLKDRYESLEKIKNIHVPVLIIHGKRDGIIPPAFSRQLFEVMNPPKQMEFIPFAGHNDLFEPALIIQFIKAWVSC